ncbi:winged helix-turn-helix domain-containing protein [Catenuloplanes atrovinosus]|uniref:GntR family transcriptional regulator n=1 Tax=Catenuloplanes atrovinosus TaxID=137266 RepID=A0AAE3YWR4_9ACTN|nr:winged helix-turn-helix domain-containing protein [Catenuloplanes atrovinosus]MDR7281165.1 GntR family transcriptional regulator [Catenuloplanes atrovinosus]
MATSKKDRVYAAIKAQILSGDLPSGHKMPSTRLLQEQYGISYGTLNTVINMLKAEKLLVGYQGDAVYVRNKPGEPPED